MADLIDTKSIASGIAALSICESLLIALSELKIMSHHDMAGVLHDAAAAHTDIGPSGGDAALQLEVEMIIKRMIAHCHSASID
jgi:hypothetical protein